MPLTERTARTAGFLGYVTLVAMVGLLGTSLWVMWDPQIVYTVLLGIDAPPDFTIWTKAGLILLGAASLAGAEWTLWNMWVLFRKYAHHEAITPACAVAIRRVGFGLIALAILSLINDPALSALVSIGQEEGSLTISFSSNDVGLLLCGGLLCLIGQVMFEAARIADDYRSIV